MPKQPRNDLLELVLEPARAARELRAHARSAARTGATTLRPGAPADLILRAGHPHGRTAARAVSWVALCVALGAHAGVAGWAAQALSLSRTRTVTPSRAPTPLRLDRVVELAAPTAPPEATTTTLPPPAAAAEPARRAAPRRSLPSAPPRREVPAPSPPAAATEAAVAETAPLDFTGFDIASGSAPRYAGGVTAASTAAVRAAHGSVSAGAQNTEGEAHARGTPVRLASRNWRCGWPRAASAIETHEQLVELRVTVESDGRVSRVRLTTDPGHGFGEAALRCARHTRFEPARDATGKPRRAESAPIRVHFTH